MKRYVISIVSIVVILIGALCVTVTAHENDSLIDFITGNSEYNLDNGLRDLLTGNLEEETAELLSEYLKYDANKVPILPVYYDKNPEWHYENGETLEDRIEQAKLIGYVDYYVIKNVNSKVDTVTQLRVYHDNEELRVEKIQSFTKMMEMPIFLRGMDAENIGFSVPQDIICFDGTSYGRQPETYLKYSSGVTVAFFYDATIAGYLGPGVEKFDEKFYANVLYCVGEAIADGNDKVSYGNIAKIANYCRIGDTYVPVELKKTNLSTHYYPFLSDYSYIFDDMYLLMMMHDCVDESVREQFEKPEVKIDEELKNLDFQNRVIIPIYKDGSKWDYHQEDKTYKDRLSAACDEIDYLVFDGAPEENVCRVRVTEADGITEIKLVEKYKMSEMPQFILDFNGLNFSYIKENEEDFDQRDIIWIVLNSSNYIYCFDGSEHGNGMDVYYVSKESGNAYLRHYMNPNSKNTYKNTEKTLMETVEIYEMATKGKDVDVELWDFTANYDPQTGVYDDGVNPAVNLKEKYTPSTPTPTPTPTQTPTPIPEPTKTEQPTKTPVQTTKEPEETPNNQDKTWFEANGLYLVIVAVAMIGVAAVAIVLKKKRR